MNEELRKYCPNCNKSKHEDKYAYYCALCGTELKIKREFYLSLNIPDSKINMEENLESVFNGCPFFLRKIDDSSIQVVLFHDYPKCKHLNIHPFFLIQINSLHRSLKIFRTRSRALCIN